MGPEIAVVAVLAALWAAGGLFLRASPPRDVSPSAGGFPAVSVIIPARNEEDNLPRLLDSLAGQGDSGVEVIVVDDASTDGTAAAARARGARVVTGKPLPPGWLGKPWACYQGALAARGEWLLFLDADTFFEEGGLRRLLETYQRTGGVLSVCPHHAVVRPHEQLSAFFNLMMAAGTGAFTGPRARPTGLFGQCMLLDRAAYFGAGGHVTVKGRVLENFHLADAFRARGVPLACRLGRGCLSMRMYPGGLSDLVRGWGKGFASGAAKTPAPLMALIVAWMIGAVSAFLAPAALPWGGPVLIIPYALYVLQLLVLLRRIGAFSPWAALLYPVPLVFYLAVFTRSVRAAKGGGVVWKGRTVGGAAGGDGHAR
ncbi:MAG: glycosyltransferase [Candidatus Hydrogenedentes bacterium]|nr:glycosyltransferase [Candidatus Hydrogenedentota bacterium]